MSMPFTKVQPKNGDVILHCGHVRNPGTGHCHFFGTRPGVKLEFRRPDGTMGIAEWLVCCEECFKQKASKFDVRGDGVWQGDEPIIRVNPDFN